MIEPKNDLEQDVIEEIKKVTDPDLKLSLYELGLIYDLKIEDGVAYIKMTLTSMACPAANRLKEEIEMAAIRADGVDHAFAEVVWIPKWDPRTMASEDAQYALGLF